MTKKNLILFTNIKKIFNKIDSLTIFKESFTKEYISEDKDDLEKLFTQEKFILSIINGDAKFSPAYLKVLIKALNNTGFPALIIASKASIKKYIDKFPITVDFIEKPVSLFEVQLRIGKIVDIYKLVQKLKVFNGLEKEIQARGNVMELSRKELIDGSETINALEIAMELSRQELIKQKEEIQAREQTLELIRKDKMDVMSQIKAFEEVLNLASQEREFYEKEIEALENLLKYLVKRSNEKPPP